MPRRSLHPVIMVLLALAVFGFFYQLIYNPGTLLSQILFTVAIVAVFFVIYKAFIQKRMEGKDQTQYRKAVKSSKKRMKGRESRPTASNPKPVKRKFRSGARKKNHLTVIEGKKGKKKDRALF